MKICPTCQQCYEDPYTFCADDQAELVPSHLRTRLIAQKYCLERLLSSDRLGATYAGTQLKTDRPLAVHLLMPESVTDPGMLKRLRHEAHDVAHLNSRIDHQHVEKTYDYGLLPDGTAYIITELIAGQSLREYLDGVGSLPTASSVRVARQLAEGLDAAHRCGVLHRALEPSNVLLTRDYYGRLEVKIINFGYAKIERYCGADSDKGAFSSDQSVDGSSYLSPEERAGRSPDERSDIYHLGLILYEMLAGHLPSEAPGEMRPLIEFRDDVPDTLVQLMGQALHEKSSMRLPSAAEAARQLRVIENIPALEVQPAGLNQVAVSSSARIPESDGGPRLPAKDIPSLVTGTHECGEEPEANYSDDLFAEDSGLLPEDHAPAEYEIPAATAPYPLTFESETPLSPVPSATADEPATTESALATAGSDPKIINLPPAQTRRPSLFYALCAIVITLSFTGAAWFAWRHAPAFHRASTQSPINAPQREQTGLITPVIADKLTPAEEASVPSQDSAPAVETSDFALTQADKPPVKKSDGAQPVKAKLAVSTGHNLQSTEQAALRAARNEWLAATNARDINREMALYSPKVEAFYHSRNTSEATVRAHKAHVFATAKSIQMQASEPEIELDSSGRTATMRFRKQWIIKGKQESRGEAVQELRWTKTEAGWKITSERNLSGHDVAN